MKIPSAAAGVSSKPVSFFFISCSAAPSSGTVLKAAGGAAPAPAPGPGAGGGGGGGAGGGGGMVLSRYISHVAVSPSPSAVTLTLACDPLLYLATAFLHCGDTEEVEKLQYSGPGLP